MKFITTPRFDSDWKNAPREHQEKFKESIPAFNEACQKYIEAKGNVQWPKRLRVSPMSSAPGIWEMTWSFAGPDGRATFSFTQVDGEPAVLWRRIGSHTVYKNP